MAEVISHESHFNQVQSSERENIVLPIFVMLLLEDSGKTKKVTMRADITQQEEINTSWKRHGNGEGRKTMRGGEGDQACGARDVRLRFVGFIWGSGGHRQIKKQWEREKKEKEERERSRRNTLRMQHNVKLSFWLISWSVRTHVAVGGLTPVCPRTLFLSLWAFFRLG